PAGNLFARDPGGVIRYQSPAADALGQSDQSVGLAMQILENFHYNQLQTGVLYQPDGQLDLALQFQGKNPDFFGGQATHLNVNLEYNLLDVLGSLRVTQDVITRLEEKYHYPARINQFAHGYPTFRINGVIIPANIKRPYHKA